jgi:hypothetical protein
MLDREEYIEQGHLFHALAERMAAGDASVFKALLGLMGNVPGTCGYWKKVANDLMALVHSSAYLNQTDPDALPPTLAFGSRSCAESWWPEL